MIKRKPRRSREFKKNSQVIDFEEARRQRQKKRKAAARPEPVSKEKQSASKRLTAKRNRRRLIYTAIFIIIIAVIGLSIFNIISLKLEQDRVNEENEALRLKKERLTEELANVDNPEYIEQQARRQLRLLMPGEILYILPETEKSTSGAASVVPGTGTGGGSAEQEGGAE